MSKLNTLLEDMGQRIANYRISRNIKQAELAKAAGLDRTTISRLESGKGTLDTLARVLSALEIEQRLLNIVPDTRINPLDLAANKTRQRLRVRDKAEAVDEETWTWGDDAK